MVAASIAQEQYFGTNHGYEPPDTMTARARGSLAILLLPSLMACGRDGSVAPSMVRDSAGVRITESAGPAWQTAVRLPSEPLLSIGVVHGPAAYQFTRITEAFRLPDGRILAANFNNPPDVRIFTAAGQHDRTIGGPGQGPGEFRGIAWLDVLGDDTLRVFDWWSSRITYFGLDGEVIQVIPITEFGGGPPNALTSAPGFAGGEILARSNYIIPRDAEMGVARSETPLIRVGRRGEAIDTIAIVPDADYVGYPDTRRMITFGRRTATLAHDTVVYVTTSDSYRVDVYARDGTQLRSYRRIAPLRPATAEDLEALIAQRAADARNDRERREIEERLRESPRADSMPAYDRAMLVDAAGNLLVQEYQAPRDTLIRWNVFDDAGRYLGDVEVPPPFRITDVGGDEVLGVWRNDLGVESVRVYELALPAVNFD